MWRKWLWPAEIQPDRQGSRPDCRLEPTAGCQLLKRRPRFLSSTLTARTKSSLQSLVDALHRGPLLAFSVWALLGSMSACVDSFVRPTAVTTWEPWPPPPLPAGAPTGVGLADRALVAYQQRLRRPHLPHHTGCQFEPSCSVYAREAYANHGAVPGLIMTANRLFFREALADPTEYAPVLIDGAPRLQDPAK